MAIFTVTNLFDAGVGSLRDAIFQANTASTTDIIDFSSSLSGGTISLTSGELRITDNLTLSGLGADLLSVDAGGNPFRVFNVDDGDFDNDLEVAIKGLTITGGDSLSSFEDGGGIRSVGNFLTVSNSTISGNSADTGGGIFSVGGSLTVSNSTISGNTADTGGGIFSYPTYLTITNTITNSTISGNSVAGNGGGIYGFGSLTMSNSTISGNSAEGAGGGIYNSISSSLTVSNSTISGNTAAGDGGGINNNFDSSLTVSNSTISGNTAAGDGGGVYNGFASLTVSNSTISGNSAEGAGGGVYSDQFSNAIITSSIIAANTNNEDVGGNNRFTSRGNNLIGSVDGVAGFPDGVNGDQVGTASNPIDPLLGVLQDNGGPTLTQALLPGSLAINAGSNPLNLEFDQRGPGFDRVVGAQTDIGAHEVPEPDSTLGILAVAVLGVVLFCKRQQRRHT